jgi:hypothetical protein
MLAIVVARRVVMIDAAKVAMTCSASNDMVRLLVVGSCLKPYPCKKLPAEVG